MKELEASGKDFCPPGIGFVHDSGRILHICPGKELSMYHYHSSKKLFGLVPIGSSTVTIENYSNSQLPQLVLNFFDEQWEAIT